MCIDPVLKLLRYPYGYHLIPRIELIEINQKVRLLFLLKIIFQLKWFFKNEFKEQITNFFACFSPPKILYFKAVWQNLSVKFDLVCHFFQRSTTWQEKNQNQTFKIFLFVECCDQILRFEKKIISASMSKK